ncbi:hypothetical protein DFH08DRAFT_837381 [Mycena albidolilacea]|uniref:DUF6533 domain-containing protein n=1 Tax=Mycena albidolilacea TaxID=1033008 RepID=A0AAD7ATX2_9AGAR|nr:hypothetical protein DFH08DRAFT_837381 [Mycena albidolilacea]
MPSESEVVNTLLFLRYLTAFGLASIVYDHCLTLGMELKFIWMNPKTGLASKAGFALNRYLTEGIIAYTVYIFSGTYTALNDETSCGRFLWIFAIIVLRIYALWDQRTNVAKALMATFLVCIVATIVTGVFCELSLQPLFKFSEFFTTCLLSSMPRLVSATFAVQSFFDVLILVIALYNALERPHQTNDEVITSLANDGFKFLLAIFCLRSLYLVSSLVGDPGQCFATVATCWCLTSIISARLHLRLDALALGADPEEPLPLPLNILDNVDSLWYDR